MRPKGKVSRHRIRKGSERRGRPVLRQGRRQRAGLHWQSGYWLVANGFQPDQEKPRYRDYAEVEADKARQETQGDVGRAEVHGRYRIPRYYLGRPTPGEFL